ncbi:hypothetical protein, partial [uncultured Methylobacterium sp.]|uniref:hypothetical protein n=1 Tax=uncultured Methylobacterium sp. TaxID=157278 RepID=UPI0026378221
PRSKFMLLDQSLEASFHLVTARSGHPHTPSLFMCLHGRPLVSGDGVVPASSGRRDGGRAGKVLGAPSLVGDIICLWDAAACFGLILVLPQSAR